MTNDFVKLADIKIDGVTVYRVRQYGRYSATTASALVLAIRQPRSARRGDVYYRSERTENDGVLVRWVSGQKVGAEEVVDRRSVLSTLADYEARKAAREVQAQESENLRRASYDTFSGLVAALGKLDAKLTNAKRYAQPFDAWNSYSDLTLTPGDAAQLTEIVEALVARLPK